MDLSVHCETTVTGVLHLVILRKLRGLNFGSEESQLSSSLKTTCILDISLHLMRPLVLLQRLDLSMSAAITDSALVAISNFLQLRYLSLKRLPKHNRQRTEASHEAKAKSVHATTSPTWDLHASSLSLEFYESVRVTPSRTHVCVDTVFVTHCCCVPLTCRAHRVVEES